MRAIFIAGTDTGVGKTVVAGLLGRYLLEKGYRVVTQKWIQAGTGKKIGTDTYFPELETSKIGVCPYFSDIDTHLKLMGKSRADYSGYLSSMMPYEFKLAASPHLAARAENRLISGDRIKRSLAKLSKDFDFVIIEGSGGLLVPVGGKKLLIDIVKELRLPVLLVAGNRLGAINNTLLSIEALRSRKMKMLGVVFNNFGKMGTVNMGTVPDPLSSRGGDCPHISHEILEDNPKIVKKLTAVEIFGTLQYSPNIKLLYKRFTPIGNKIVAVGKV